MKVKKAFKILGITLLSIIGLLLTGVIIIFVNSPGKLEPLKDSEGHLIAGALAEKNFVEIGGIRQGYFIRSENPKNEVILFLHGGPGSPELPLTIPREISERLEKYFTVVYWEQRGAGMSFNNSIDPTTMTLGQMIEDAHQMTAFLKNRFEKEKIYLIGHSWGTYLGVKTIEKYPEDYHAYIAIAQITNQKKSERLAFDYLLKHASDIGDQSAVRDLQKIDRNAPDFPGIDYIMTIRSVLMNSYGVGITREKISTIDLIKDLLFFKGYTLTEKVNYLRGSLFSLEHLWNTVVMNDNLFESSTSFQVPVFLTHGKWDYQVSYTLARDWFEKIDAPDKAFFSFDNSAHSPNMELPEKFVQIVREIAMKNLTQSHSD